MTDDRRALDVIAVVPLPYLCDGAPRFSRGVSIFYADLLPRLAELGHRIRVLAETPALDRGDRRTDDPFLAGLEIDWSAIDYQSSRGSACGESMEPLRSQIESKLGDAIRQRRPDLVLFGREVTAMAGLDLCRSQSVPSVLVCHNVALTELESGRYGRARGQDLIDCFRTADRIIAIAEHVERRLRHLGASRVDTVSNVVDAERFRPRPRDTILARELQLDFSRPLVGHVSNMNPAKRADEVVAVAARLRDLGRGVGVLFVGDGGERARLEEIVAALDLQKDVRFVGEVNHGAMPQFLNLCDVVVQPSENEGMPLACLEAQACGRVVLAGDIPATREIIDHGRTGMLFPVGDVATMAEQILRISEDESLRNRIEMHARHQAEARSSTDWALRYAAILQATADGSTVDAFTPASESIEERLSRRR